LARRLAQDMEAAGSPLRLSELAAYRAEKVKPLSADVAGHRGHNKPTPTQGLASLLLLAPYAAHQADSVAGFDFVHRIVESTKAAFRVRDRHVTDPAHMSQPAESFLTAERLSDLAGQVSYDKAAPWPHPAKHGDTV